MKYLFTPIFFVLFLTNVFGQGFDTGGPDTFGYSNNNGNGFAKDSGTGIAGYDNGLTGNGGGGLPNNVMTFNGQPMLFNGAYMTFSGTP